MGSRQIGEGDSGKNSGKEEDQELRRLNRMKCRKKGFNRIPVGNISKEGEQVGNLGGRRSRWEEEQADGDAVEKNSKRDVRAGEGPNKSGWQEKQDG